MKRLILLALFMGASALATGAGIRLQKALDAYKRSATTAAYNEVKAAYENLFKKDARGNYSSTKIERERAESGREFELALGAAKGRELLQKIQRGIAPYVAELDKQIENLQTELEETRIRALGAYALEELVENIGLKLEDALKKLHDGRLTNDQMGSELSKLTQQLKTAEQKLKESQTREEGYKAQIEKLAGDVAALNTAKVLLEQSGKVSQEAIASLTGQINKARENLEAAAAKEKQDLSNFDGVKRELKAAEEKIKELEGKLTNEQRQALEREKEAARKKVEDEAKAIAFKEALGTKVIIAKASAVRISNEYNSKEKLVNEAQTKEYKRLATQLNDFIAQLAEAKTPTDTAYPEQAITNTISALDKLLQDIGATKVSKFVQVKALIKEWEELLNQKIAIVVAGNEQLKQTIEKNENVQYIRNAIGKLRSLKNEDEVNEDEQIIEMYKSDIQDKFKSLDALATLPPSITAPPPPPLPTPGKDFASMDVKTIAAYIEQLGEKDLEGNLTEQDKKDAAAALVAYKGKGGSDATIMSAAEELIK